MQQKRKISIDLGNGYVKVAFNGKVFMFRAAFREGIREDNSSEGYDVKFDGKDYVVGAGNTSTTLISEKVTDISTLLYIVNAINIAFDSTQYVDNVELTLGLPASYVATYRDTLKKFIIENLTDKAVVFGDKRKVVSIADVKVGMQGAIFATDIDAFANKKTLVMDVGAGTLDCLLFDNFKLIGEPLTLEVGMQKYWESLMVAINKSDDAILAKSTKYTDYKDVENCVIRGEFIVNRKSYGLYEKDSPFAPIIDRTLKMHFDQQLNTIKSTFATDTLHNIILTGGGASFLKKYFESKLGPCMLVNFSNTIVDMNNNELTKEQTQQFVNAINYYKLSMMNDK